MAKEEAHQGSSDFEGMNREQFAIALYSRDEAEDAVCVRVHPEYGS